MNHLIYLAHSNKGILNEAVYSILSLLRFGLPKFKIIVYTDQPEYFNNFFSEIPNIEYEKITQEQITIWRGELDFVHRVKVKFLQDFTSKNSGNFLFVDSDTYFLKEIDPLFNLIEQNYLLMHLKEGVISTRKNPIFKKIHNYIKRKRFVIEGEEKKIPENIEMWNSGVLGFNNNYIYLLDKVLDLTDQLYGGYKKHIMEQFAYSYYFQVTKSVIPTDEYFFHYWDFKFFKNIIQDFLDKYNDSGYKKLAALTPEIAPYNMYHLKPKKRRWWQKLLNLK